MDRDLGKWRHRISRLWRSFWNEDSISVELMADNGKILKYKYGHARIYLRDLNQNSGAVSGVPVTVENASENSLRILRIGTTLAEEEPVEKATSFVKYLKQWG